MTDLQLRETILLIFCAALASLLAFTYLQPNFDIPRLQSMWEEGFEETGLSGLAFMAPGEGFGIDSTLALKIDKDDGKLRVMEQQWWFWVEDSEGTFQPERMIWGYWEHEGKYEWARPNGGQDAIPQSFLNEYGFYKLDEVLQEFDSYGLSRIMESLEDAPYEIHLMVHHQFMPDADYYNLSNGEIVETSKPEDRENQIPVLILRSRAPHGINTRIYLLADLARPYDPKPLPLKGTPIN